MEAASRLIEHVDPPFLRHVDRQLQALSFATGECHKRLADGEVAEPNVGKSIKDEASGRDPGMAIGQESPGFGDGHREDLADVPAIQLVVEHLALEPLALALFALDGDSGHDRQVEVDDPGAIAVGAAALGVSAEQGRLYPVGLGERFADRIEQAGVSRRVAPP